MIIRNHSIIVPQQRLEEDSQFPILDLEAIVNPTLTLCKIRDMFRQTTSLDLFLFFQNQPMGKWREEPFSQSIRLPRYCQLIRSHPIGLARCLYSHQIMTKKAVESHRPVCQRCHAGLATIHFPVSIVDIGSGDLQTVCALHRGDRSDRLSQIQNKISELDIPQKEIVRSLEELQILSKAKEHRIIGWLELIADYLSERTTGSLCEKNGRINPPNENRDCPPIEHKIRHEIGRSLSLPSWRSQRCSGVTGLLAEQVIAFVYQNIHLPLSTQIVAQALGFDPTYFAKAFKQYARESLTTNIKRIRLSHAQKWLKDPYLSIQEVANRTGFADASYFTRVFRNAFGVTPTQYRELSNRSI
ncbi:MAG: helix-turn-helix domain-containing protein [Candidatus Omnitrophota bacterium]